MLLHSVIEGKLPICKSEVFIDHGAIHSFVFPMFEHKLDVYPYLLLPVLAVSTPMCDIVLADKVYKS